MATIIRADGLFKYEGDVSLVKTDGYTGIILEGSTTLARELELARLVSGKPGKVKIVVERTE